MKKLIIVFVLLFTTSCYAELQCLIKVPATEKIKKKDYTLSDQVREKFKQKKGQVTDDLLWNTRVFKDYKLINFVTQMTLPELQVYIINEKLKWTILAANDEIKQIEVDGEIQTVTNTLIYYDHDEIINFIVRDRIYDELGELFTEMDPVIVELGRFAGMRKFESKK